MVQLIRIPAAFAVLATTVSAQTTYTLPVKGYAKTSVNTVVFRGNSVVTHGNTQFTAYYDSMGYVVLAKHALGSGAWETKTTAFVGKVTDAHNSISIELDGDGFLHMVWNTHSSRLFYARSQKANSLEMGDTMPMTKLHESKVTYPQFFRRPNGDLLFFYRDGESGNGNLTVNRYDLRSKTWTQLHSNLIAGEGTRSAYWEAHQDVNGVIHVGWVWRETSDVSTNHDQCYARSDDGGVTWKMSTGAVYTPPIKAANAETVYRIAQKSDLMNQTSIFGDEKSRPFIASYWTPAGTGIPQYQLIYNLGSGWQNMQITNRTTAYSLSGGGTKPVPFSRPQVVVDGSGDSVGVYMVYRDIERGSKVTLASTTNLGRTPWRIADIFDSTVNFWEPSYDPHRWKTDKILSVFVQNAQQGPNETAVEGAPAQVVRIFDWNPKGGISGISKTSIRAENSGKRRVDALGREILPVFESIHSVENGRVGVMER